jgi:hypothetical protein
MTQTPTDSWMQRKVSDLVESKQENDLLLSLRQRKMTGYLTLSESERAQCAVMLRRRPHLKDRSDEWLKSMSVRDLF